MFTYKKEEFKVPIKSWVPEKDYYSDATMVKQCENLAKLPFAFHHIVLSSDGHVGYGMPIGGVMATDGVIVPNAVGVDIACGMCAVKTSLKTEDLPIDTLKKIMGEIRRAVPVGFNKHKKEQDENLMPPLKTDDLDSYPIVTREYSNALKSLGTLGGGNHFMEILKDENDYIWIMVHSGSRNLGKKVADHYNQIAVSLNEKSPHKIPKEWQLASLPADSKEGKAYVREMQYCIDYALASRKLMLDRIKQIFIDTLNNIDIDFDETINIAHNYASLENHFGKNVWVHRKGATLATKGIVGIVPGSQGTKSYIVEGLGNKESFESCSHGAGRKMGRKQAQRELNLEEEKKKLDDQGIVHGVRNIGDLDEAAGAYKDISEVMENQKDLVKILHELTPMGVVKG